MMPCNVAILLLSLMPKLSGSSLATFRDSCNSFWTAFSSLSRDVPACVTLASLAAAIRSSTCAVHARMSITSWFGVARAVAHGEVELELRDEVAVGDVGEPGVLEDV